tara:strand:+ start:14366 stop:16507 length:2142 start_codon:yes stop_codon:yes gene_type:complete
MVLVLGAILSIWSFKVIYEQQQFEAKMDLENSLENFIQKVNLELNASTEVLHAVSNLIKTIDSLTPMQFKTFTSDFAMRNKSILMVEWQPKVLSKDRKAFEKRVREKFHPNYQMLEPDQSGRLVPAKNRPVHYPVLFVDSTKGEKSTIGLDLAWSNERMISKIDARDSGQARASNTFKVMTTDGAKKFPQGFAITLPVYESHRVPDSLEERKNHFKGFLAAVIYLDDLFNPFVAELHSKNMNISIKDLNPDNFIVNPKIDESALIVQDRIVDVFGQSWHLKISAGKSFLMAYHEPVHYIAPFVFLIFIITLFYILYRNELKNRELSKTRNDLQEALKKAHTAARSKMLFLANMSHEIRTPMNAILGYARLLKKEDDKERQHYFTGRMEDCGEHLLKLLDDILEISSHEEGNIKIEPHSFSLKELVAEIEDLLQNKYSDSKVNFQSQLKVQNDLFYGDSDRIKQVLINLLNNAYKFTEAGEVKLEIAEEEISSEHNGSVLHIIVQDTGLGIDEKYLDQIYSPFSQEDGSFQRKKGGIGLGLAIVNNIIKMMKGSIDVHSVKDQGTKFSIKLPIELAKESDSEISELDLIETKLTNTARKNILIAEDDQDARFLIKVYLEDQNVNIDLVTNGEELLESFSKKKYDLILTDIQMPKLDGLSATKKLRDQGVAIPILALSAHALPEEKEKSLDAGIDAILSKPLHQEKLINFINDYL